MSHFTVLVVTRDLNPGTLERALQPFHEYECTGVDDEYVRDVDVTDELMKSWSEPTRVVRLADGSLISAWDERLYRNATPEETRLIGAWNDADRKTRVANPVPFEFSRGGFGLDETYRVKQLPPGAEFAEVPQSELSAAQGQTLAQYAEEYGGWKEGLDGRFYKHTNPNRQWDWWSVGGRWNGMLKLKPGAVGRQGEGGLMTPPKEGGIDQCRKGDLDVEAMRQAAVAERLKGVQAIYAKVKEKLAAKVGAEDHRVTDSNVTALWLELRAIYLRLNPVYEALETKSGFWDWLEEQEPRVVELRALDVANIGTWGWDTANVPVEEADPFEWAGKAPALGTFAFLGLDGVWRERGDMGWFGMVSDEKDPGAWEQEYAKALAEVPDDCFISIVDCHT